MGANKLTTKLHPKLKPSGIEKLIGTAHGLGQGARAMMEDAAKYARTHTMDQAVEDAKRIGGTALINAIVGTSQAALQDPKNAGKMVLGGLNPIPVAKEAINAVQTAQATGNREDWKKATTAAAMAGVAFTPVGGEASGAKGLFREFGDFTVEGRSLLMKGKPVGTIKLRMDDGPRPHVVIDDIEIKPSMQRQGIGSAAINAVRDQAHQNGLGVALTSDAMRGKRAQADQRRLYDRLGFAKNKGADKIKGLQPEFYDFPSEHPISLDDPRIAHDLTLPDGSSLPLDMSYEARLARANEQGFTIPAYHGTNQPIDDFDLDRLGASTKSHSASHAIFSTDNPDVAAAYAEHAASTTHTDVTSHEALVAKLQSDAHRLQRIAERTGKNEDWNVAEAAQQAWEDYEINATRAEPTGQNILPLRLRMGRSPVYDAAGGVIELRDRLGQDFGDMLASQKATGQRGVTITNLDDTPNMSLPATHYATFSPDDVRSSMDPFHPGGIARVGLPRPGSFRVEDLPDIFSMDDPRLTKKR